MTETKPVVLVTRKLPEAVEARLARDYDPRLNPTDRLYASEALIEAARGADAILPCHTEHLSADVIVRLPAEVRIIANFSVGYDHVDTEAAKARGIVVTNTPDVLSDATAEIALLLILGAARRASEGERLVRSAGWRDWSPAFMVGRQVTGKRLGIIGMGRVGQVVARRARGFDMEIHYHNRERLEPDAEAGARHHDSIDELLPMPMDAEDWRRYLSEMSAAFETGVAQSRLLGRLERSTRTLEQSRRGLAEMLLKSYESLGRMHEQLKRRIEQ